MREKISHVIIKLHGKKVHTYDQNFSHVLQNFTRMSKSSHMHVKC